ncbi:hypothetical protein D3C87_655890 [compost metagenome]
MAVGTKDLIGFAIESVFGTPPAAPTKAWPFRGDRPTPRMEAANDEDTKTGSQILGSESVVVRRWLEASGLEMDARVDNLAFWLYVALGGIATTGSSPTYTHVITNNGGEKPSLTAFFKDALTPAGKLEAYPGLKVRSLTIRSQEGAKVIVLPDLIGKGVDSNYGFTEVTASMAALNRDNPITHGKIDKLLIGGVDFKDVLRSFELVIAPQYSINDEYGANGLLIPQLECTGVQITTNVEFNHNDFTKAVFPSVLLQIGLPLEVNINMGAHSCKIKLPAVFLDDTAVTGGKAKLRKSFSGKAYEDLATAKAIEATVINATASYTA